MTSFRSVAVLAALSVVGQVQAWNIDLPPCVDPFQPFVYSGCYNSKPNALVFKSDEPSKGMTIERCVAECKGNNFRYAGLAYYGVCYCGNTVAGAQLEESKCNLPCDGNKTQTCGGNNIVSVYQDPTFLPEAEADITDYVELGCYTDNTGSKTLSFPAKVDKDTLTNVKCHEACLTQGFPFAGTEYGGECYCGVVLGNGTSLVDNAKCNTPCKGNTKEMCGGRGHLTLYVAKDLQSLEPCGHVPPVQSSSTVTTQSSTSTSSSSTVPPTSSLTSATTSVTSSSTSTSVTSSSTSTSVTSSSTSTSATSSSTSVVTSSSTSSTSSSSSSSTKTSSTSKSTSSTTCLTSSTTMRTSTTTSKPPTSTTKPPTSTTSPPTTKPPTSTKTTSSALCVSTVTVPSGCEYGCGKWCADELPDWDNQEGCKNGHSHCKLQVADCLKTAGWPDVLKCFDFSIWCKDMGSYCGNWKKGNKCSKKDWFSYKPPKGGKPPKTTTTVVPCKPTSTTKATTTPKTSTKATTTPKTSTKATTTSTTTTKCPIPSVTNICKQPTNKQYGYGPENPVGDIELPIVTCNDLRDDYNKGNIFKLYNNKDSKKCPGYTRPQCSNACVDACKEQYNQCEATYVEGCKQNDKPPSPPPPPPFKWPWWKRDAQSVDRSYFAYHVAPEKRTWGWQDKPNAAKEKCKAQYNDCVAINKNINVKDKCPRFGVGF